MCSVSPLLDLVWQSATRFFTPICNFFVSFLSAASARFDKIKIVNTTRNPHKGRIVSIGETSFSIYEFSKKRIDRWDIKRHEENEQAYKDEMTWVKFTAVVSGEGRVRKECRALYRSDRCAAC